MATTSLKVLLLLLKPNLTSMTGYHIQVKLNLNWQTFCILLNKCLVAISISCSTFGRLCWWQMVPSHLLNCMRIYMQQLTWPCLQTVHGNHSNYNTMVPSPNMMSHLGWHLNMRCGIATLARLSRTSFQTRVLTTSLIVRHFRNTTQTGTTVSRILCLVTGAGNKWYMPVSFELRLSSYTVWDTLQDIIAEDPITHGSMFIPIILGSDKTTVSVATGNNEYWPIYLSIGNIHNNVQCAHQDGLVLLGFLAVPKSKSKVVMYHGLLLIIMLSQQKAFWWCWLSQIPPPVVPFLPCQNSQASQVWNDNTQGRTLSQWPLQACHLWAWTLHCRLSQTSPSGLHHTRLVCKVSSLSFYFSFLIMNCITRCMASAKNLDGGDATCRCREHTDFLVEELELGILWDEYGLVGDIIVSIFC